MKKRPWLIVLVLVILVGGFVFIQRSAGKKSLGETAYFKMEPTATPTSALLQIDTQKTYQAILKTTIGDIEIVLNASATPVTVNNFVSLSRKNFYDNTVFHRVIRGFMIQGGDPKGDGTGGPGYTFADEPFSGEYERGIVAMANAGPDTNGSQFFIMQSDYDLPKKYVIFGKVTGGIEVVDKIASSPVVNNSFGEPSKPVNPVLIKSVEVIER